MDQTIEKNDVADILFDALPECRADIEEHRSVWGDDPMLYLLVGEVFQRMIDMPNGPERKDFVARVYAITEKMLTAGCASVRDCFAIEMLEPLAEDKDQQYCAGLENAVGPVGREEIRLMREWFRTHEASIRQFNASYLKDKTSVEKL